MSLATENDELTASSAREAISALQGEMQGLYKNVRREDYGSSIRGLDFRVDGLGSYKNVTHLEVKNPVGSEILRNTNQKASVARQGKSIGSTITNQKKIWSDSDMIGSRQGINLNASFPKSVDNVLGLIDTFDVPVTEKPVLTRNVIKSAKSEDNLVFIDVREF